jgi:P4 family phage/plasmid primase-like protien
VVKNRVVHLLGPRYRQSHASNTADVIAAKVVEIQCDPVPRYFNCLNGMVDWRTGDIIPHRPDFYSTVQFPWEWDDTAVCPMFDSFMEEMLSPDYAELAWQMLGYSMYSGNPKQNAFMLLGKGGEGKGTLLRVLVAMLGKENISTETLTSLNSSKFSAINLFGKIANIAGDIEKTFQTETNIFKALTGQDYIGAEHKYGARFSFSNWAVPIFSANQIPGSADVSKGYLRRWLMIEFTHPPENPQDDFSDRLSLEIPGIAMKAVKYLRTVMHHGFKQDGDIAQGLNDFAKAVDQVRLWTEECCETPTLSVVGQPHRTPRSDLYKSYRAWAQENNNGVLKAHEFYERLKTAGYRETKISGVRYFEGIKVVVLAFQGTVYDTSEPPQAVDRWSTTS